MNSYAFDIETDGLIPELTTITSLCMIDLETGEETAYKPADVVVGLRRLADAEMVVAHNGIAFDIPAIQKLYPWWSPPLVRDTLVLSRIAWPDLREQDYARFGKVGLRAHGKRMFNGSHSLGAHGIRLGFPKGEFTGDWKDGWSEELEHYCMQDVRVTVRLFNQIDKLKLSPAAIDLEHRFAKVCYDMEAVGFPFNYSAADDLQALLQRRQDDLTAELTDKYGGWYEPDGDVVVPKRSAKYKTRPEVTAGVPYQKVKYVVLNPGSRQHIERVLRSEGWVPSVFTDTSGAAKIDESTLMAIADKYPSAKLFAEQFTVQKRLGLLESWLEAGHTGRIHATTIPNSCATSRTSSRSPNLQQIPSVHSAYGRECRSLFTAGDGRVLLAADLDKAELMLLAHYMARYDGGAYAAMLTEGDIHQTNADAMGVSRQVGKRTIFALLYGSGDKLLGEITGRPGAEIRADLMEAFPALDKLINDVQARVAKDGRFKALDGRMIPCAGRFKALNYLIQSSTSIVGKQWASLAVERIAAAQIPCNLVAYVHDEIQFDCAPEYVEWVSDVIKSSLAEACKFYELRVNMTCETQTGPDWSQSH